MQYVAGHIVEFKKAVHGLQSDFMVIGTRLTRILINLFIYVLRQKAAHIIRKYDPNDGMGQAWVFSPLAVLL